MSAQEVAGLLGAAEREAWPVLLVVAHPDDETIGAGARLRRLPGAHVVFLTDGAPADGVDARARGFARTIDYGRARRDEALAALALAGLPAKAATWLGAVDKQAMAQLPELARALVDLLAERAPALVVTHAYEGGHPDHDATAFTVHAAVRLLSGAGKTVPPILELGSYHADPDGSGEVRRLEFLPAAEPIHTDHLDPEARAHKQRMFACHATQLDALRDFPRDMERFRRAPAYTFTAAPHAGRLHYESFGWGVTGTDFRAAAALALRALALGE
jgi:LmbE family N-acetylglucosaminyl deacetylase